MIRLGYLRLRLNTAKFTVRSVGWVWGGGGCIGELGHEKQLCGDD